MFNKFFFVVFFACGFSKSTVPRKITFVNNCKDSIWVSAKTDIIQDHGWSMKPREVKVINTYAGGEFGARPKCVGSTSTGQYMNCGGKKEKLPCSQIAIGISRYSGIDFYSLANIEGHNIPLSLEPVLSNGGQPPSDRNYHCKKVACAFNMEWCPKELQVRDGNGLMYCLNIGAATRRVDQRSKNSVLSMLWQDKKALVSASCNCFNTNSCSSNPLQNVQQYPCCLKGVSARRVCPSTFVKPSEKVFATYRNVFKLQCPDAYSNPMDDRTSTFVCKNVDYKITFCYNGRSTWQGSGVANFAPVPLEEYYKVHTTPGKATDNY